MYKTKNVVYDENLHFEHQNWKLDWVFGKTNSKPSKVSRLTFRSKMP